MARTTPWEDEYTLLCERCGYVIEGLPTEGDCPECARPIAESLPEQRVGTAWQRNLTSRSFLITACMTLRHPLKTLEVMRFENRAAGDLLRVYLAVSAIGYWLVGVSTFGVWITVDTLASAPFPDAQLGALILFIGFAAGLALTTPVTYLLLAILTSTERFGMRFISERRGRRLTSAAALAICAHGCVGWLIASLLTGTFASLAFLADAERWHPVVFGVWFNLPLIFAWLAVAGAIAGLLIFESFAYLGLRRCRFANRTRPGNPAQPTDPAGSADPAAGR